MNIHEEQSVPCRMIVRQILDSLSFPIYSIDVRTHRITFSNRRALDSGISVGSSCFSILHKRDTICEKHDCPLEQVKKTKGPVSMEHIHYNAGGCPRNVEAHGFPTFDRAGNLVEFTGYYLDVTECRTAEDMWKKYEFIVNTAKELMSLVGRGYVYETVNSSFCEAHKLSCDEIIGRPVPAIWGEETFRDDLKKYFDECFAGKEAHHETWVILPSRGRCCLDVGYYPYHDSRGEVSHAVVLARDITKRKLAEDVLRISEEKYAKAFCHSPERVAITTLSEGRYIDVNEAFLRFTGFHRNEVIGNTSAELGIWVDPGEREEAVRILSSQGELIGKEMRFRSKSGTVHTVLWSAELVHFEGQPCVISVARDITERKRAEEMLEIEVSSLKKRLLRDALEHEDAFAEIITADRSMRAIFNYVEVIAPSGEVVLITGETGVGKELIAHTLHRVSGRRGSFVAVNVAGLDDSMFSDTLFGHAKGAYTGAEHTRDGLISQASGGTLFLDEIGDLNEHSQLKLLRLFQERSYYPLGSDVPRESDVRMVVSTNRPIQALVAEGKFRRDLFYRLRQHHIHIPPLRERKGDMPLLLEHFIKEAASILNKNIPPVSSELIQLLSAYSFPGNVRELRSMVFDAVARHKSGRLSINSFAEFMAQMDLPAGSRSDQAGAPTEDAAALIRFFGRFPKLKEAEHLLIAAALDQAHGNQGAAASLLGISRQALNKRLLRKPEIKHPKKS